MTSLKRGSAVKTRNWRLRVDGRVIACLITSRARLASTSPRWKPTSSIDQHEFNGVSALRELLGGPPGAVDKQGGLLFLDDEMEPLVADSTLTWYDARAAHPTRSEHRLYYPATQSSRLPPKATTWSWRDRDMRRSQERWW